MPEDDNEDKMHEEDLFHADDMSGLTECKEEGEQPEAEQPEGEGEQPEAEAEGEPAQSAGGDEPGLYGDTQDAEPRAVEDHQLSEGEATPATEQSFIHRGDMDHSQPVDLGDENLAKQHAVIGRAAQEQNDPEVQKQMGQEALDALNKMKRSQQIADRMASGATSDDVGDLPEGSPLEGAPKSGDEENKNEE